MVENFPKNKVYFLNEWNAIIFVTICDNLNGI